MSSPFAHSFSPASTVSGGGGSVASYSERVDFASETVIYRGEAMPGTAESAPLWRIRRLEISADGDVTTKWAGGSAEFYRAWSDRATLEYL